MTSLMKLLYSVFKLQHSLHISLSTWVLALLKIRIKLGYNTQANIINAVLKHNQHIN